MGVLFSYDTQGNNKHNFDIKIQKLQTNLDMWRARDSTLFGKVLIIKALGVSPLVYSASKTDLSREVVRNVQSLNRKVQSLILNFAACLKHTMFRML